VYPSERNVFYKEHADRAYSVEAFFVQYTALELPFEIVTAFLFALLGDLAIGLPRTAEAFFVVAYCCFCIVSCGESLGVLFNTVFDHAGFAINITSIFLSLGQIMAGAMSINMPSFLNAFNHLSPLKYALAVLAQYTFRGVEFSCAPGPVLSTGQCIRQGGEEILKLYKLDKSVRMNVMALGICVVCYRLSAYFVLKFSRDGFRLSP
jgi:ABC-type multidrug transport system permease subunit